MWFINILSVGASGGVYYYTSCINIGQIYGYIHGYNLGMWMLHKPVLWVIYFPSQRANSLDLAISSNTFSPIMLWWTPREAEPREDKNRNRKVVARAPISNKPIRYMYTCGIRLHSILYRLWCKERIQLAQPQGLFAVSRSPVRLRGIKKKKKSGAFLGGGEFLFLLWTRLTGIYLCHRLRFNIWSYWILLFSS